MADYSNPVPLGEAGTGAAYLLPQSGAAAGMENLLDNRIQAGYADAANNKAKALQIANAWRANQLNIKGGTIYQPEINARASKVMKMGMDLQRLNVDPNGYSDDPNTQKLLSNYQTEKAALLSDVDARDKIAEQAKANEKLIASHPAGYFNKKTVDAYHRYLSGEIPLSQITAHGLQMPELQQQYNLGEEVQKLTPIPVETTGTANGVKTKMVLPNETAHRSMAHDLLQNNPEARADAEEKIGMPLDALPDTADIGKLKQQLDAYYRSKPAIQSLAAQGINTYTDSKDSNGVPDKSLPGSPMKVNPKYDQFLTDKAKTLASAKNKYDNIIEGIKSNLDNRVHQVNDKSWDFAYQREMRDRVAHGQTTMRFNEWLKDKQEEEGETSIGNSGSFVPVRMNKLSSATGQPGVDDNGKVIPAQTVLEPGASLFTTRMPSVDVTLQPSRITSLDNKTGGRTYKNAAPISMKVGGLKMVPVWTGLKDNEDNGNELSLRQLNEVSNAKWKGRDISNVTYKPVVYGIQDVKDEKGHGVPTPISIPYEDFKGGDTKKVNTKKFQSAIDQYHQLLQNPEYLYTTDPSTGQKRKTTPAEKVELLKQFYQIQDQ